MHFDEKGTRWQVGTKTHFFNSFKNFDLMFLFEGWMWQADSAVIDNFHSLLSSPNSF